VLAAQSETALAIFSVVVLGGGYVAIFALWWFVFRKKTEDEQRREANDGGAAASASPTAQPSEEGPTGPRPGRELSGRQIRRR
jgi:hypothetical protein